MRFNSARRLDEFSLSYAASVRVLLFAAVLSTFPGPALDPPPGTPCVGFYATTCSLIELVPDDPSRLPADVHDAVCRRTGCPA